MGLTEKNASEVLDAVLADLHDIMVENVSSNRVFIPSLNTVTKLLSDLTLRSKLGSRACAETIPQIITLASRSVSQIKSIERLSGSMKL